MINFLFILVGLMAALTACFPMQAWRLSEGWKYRDSESVEPSSAYLMSTRIGGTIGAVLCLLLALTF